MKTIKKQAISFEALEKMNSIEFMNRKWSRTATERASEAEFAWRNFRLQFAFFGGSTGDQISVTLHHVRPRLRSWDVQEAWGKTVNSALRELETVIFQIAVLTR